MSQVSWHDNAAVGELTHWERGSHLVFASDKQAESVRRGDAYVGTRILGSCGLSGRG